MAKPSDMLTIETATPAHIESIRLVAQEVWPKTYLSIIGQEQMDFMLEWMYSASSLQEQMNDAHTEFLVVKKGEQVFGFASYTLSEESKSKLNKLYVLSTAQGLGLGKLLLQEVEKRSAQRGASVLELQVNKYNEAKSFYEKYGFTVKEAFVFDIGHGYVMDDFVMHKSLVV
jgi:ribosomal protein S18 acetylase RimI-like enzyme